MHSINSSRLRSGLLILFVVSLFIIPTVTVAAPPGQGNTPAELAADRLSRLTAEEKVGQLFMVEFAGNRVEEDSELFDLIGSYHIGGVVLKRENNNFTTSGDAMLNTWLLIQEIQRAEISNSRVRQVDPSTGNSFSPALVPLFVGVSQNGDGYPYDQILTELSPLPSPMAIGATWKPELAFDCGEVLGRELSALGINMLFGPSLNINSNPRPELGGDLGTSSFGGSPYWVGEMGAQFIAGVHTGSNNQIAVISKQFPGNTGSDRPRAEEIPTIRRTLEQLTGFEFLPFIKVTGGSSSEELATDGLLLSHAKYQAFQSNVTTATPPITLDAQAMEQLISVNSFMNWYSQGGVIVSDELWNQAIRRFFEQQAAEFRPALIARDALIAGNDILVLAGLDPEGNLNPYDTIRATLDFFAQKYREDQAFALRVDDAVLRTLTLKYEIYPTFDSETILTSSTRLLDIGESADVAFEIARGSATLIDPSRENLANVLPSAPTGNDQIVVISDGYSYQQCDACDTEFYPSVDAFQQAVLRLYGESGDGLISMWNISSFSTTNLLNGLDYEGEDELPIFAEIRRARWVVFLFLDADPNRPESGAMVRFLSEMPDMIQDKKTVVFSFNSPYYLDATSISQVTAYFGLYSKQPQFFEIAARLLFQELNASSSSPVSISGTGYLLEEALQPGVQQTITINLILPDQNDPGEQNETPAPGCG
jgi:beta-N-acetylhexosaminidase